MNALVRTRRKPPLGGLTASPGHHDFAGRITAPHALVDWTVQAAIIASLQRVHHHQCDTASIFALISRLAPLFLAPAGAFGLASVSCTSTGVGFGVTFAATFVEFRRRRRWSSFAIDFDDENLA